MFKVKPERTADCVVAGYRPHKSGPDRIGSLLGLYNEDGTLCSGFRLVRGWRPRGVVPG